MIDRGHRSRTPRIDLFWVPNPVGHPRIGVIVPRHGASAVARNRVRRRLREVLRRRVLPALTGVDLVVRARESAYRAGSEDVARDLERWQQALPR